MIIALLFLCFSQTVHRSLIVVGAAFDVLLACQSYEKAVEGLIHHEVEGCKLTLELCLNTIVMSAP